VLYEGKALAKSDWFSTKRLFKKGIIRAVDLLHDCTHTYKAWMVLKLKFQLSRFEKPIVEHHWLAKHRGGNTRN
jgi:hypothetical protein